MWFSRAFLSVITPLEVETIAIPRPFRTLGSSSAPAYTLRPGLETRRRPVMTCCFLPRYLRPRFRYVNLLLYGFRQATIERALNFAINPLNTATDREHGSELDQGVLLIVEQT